MIKCFMVQSLRGGEFRHNDKILAYEELPVGSMWFADWYSRKGPDGHRLFVMTPGGSWSPDGRANNCTKPNDNEHYCWVRHGIPPDITVDKNGNTCGCGHSIGLGPNYSAFHGFLTNGYLISV